MKLKRVHSMLVAAVLVCSMSVMPVYATPEEDANAQKASLENQKAAKENEVGELQTQLNTLLTKLNELEVQSVIKCQEIAQAQEDLEAAEEKRQQQYEDMKLRIKYMYEEGDNSAVERILASGNIAEVLSQAEYVQKVHTYDRDMLQEYADTVAEIEVLENTLEQENAELQEMRVEYEAQSDELSTTIESKRAEVDNLDAMIQEAARAAVEAAAKAEAERAAAAQAAAAQAAAAQTASNSGASEQPAATTTDVPSETTEVPETVPEPSYDAATGNAVVDRAYSWVGNAEYVWGACSPGQFDCSGFVSYCLTGSYTRLGTTYTFLGWTQVSDPQPGDVCVNAGHCGIYIGGGQMIHAADYGIGVIVGPVQDGMIYVRY